MSKMTPEQKIKWKIVLKAEDEIYFDASDVSEDTIDDVFSDLEDHDSDYVYDQIHYELRCGEVETNIPCESSRHYESKSVASKMPDGSWVGWTYWYGGGKHGEPGSIDWVEYAYDLDCVEEEKLVTVRTFTKKE